MPGRAFSRPQAVRPGPSVHWFSGLRFWGLVGARWELGQAEEFRQHPLPLVPERVIDGVIQTDGFHQAHRQRAMIFPFRRHIFYTSIKLL